MSETRAQPPYRRADVVNGKEVMGSAVGQLVGFEFLPGLHDLFDISYTRFISQSLEFPCSWELGREYGLTDYDGRRPDWGRHKIDFSTLPPAWIDLFRRGADLESKWLTTLAGRTRRFRTKIPP